VSYVVRDSGYGELLDRVLSIFDRERSESVPVEERIAAADALGQAGDPRIDFTSDDYWVTIPATEFWMGAQSTARKKRNYDEEADDDERPVHRVSLDAYRIARYPMTVGQYQQFIDDEGYQDVRWWHAGGFGEFSKPEDWDDQRVYPSRPVVGVSWSEAAAGERGREGPNASERSERASLFFLNLTRPQAKCTSGFPA
jgi:formylglycine-generating enzyme required for sulfatase activity